MPRKDGTVAGDCEIDTQLPLGPERTGRAFADASGKGPLFFLGGASPSQFGQVGSRESIDARPA